jgi:hypothetical protein
MLFAMSLVICRRMPQMREDLSFLDESPAMQAWLGAPLHCLAPPLLVLPDGFPTVATRAEGEF